MGDRELDEALAKAAGWHYQLPRSATFVYAQSWAQAEKKISGGLSAPAFSESIDALSGGPEKVLREKDLRLQVIWQPAALSYWAAWDTFEGKLWHAFDPSEATARARAALAAFNALAARPEETTDDR